MIVSSLQYTFGLVRIANFISDLPGFVVARSEPIHSDYFWRYTEEPIEADIHIVYGTIRELIFPNKNAIRIFVTTEPPEIFRYSRQILSNFDYVLSGDFPYLSDMTNKSTRTGLLNWSIGIERKDGILTASESLESLLRRSRGPKQTGISIVTSNKAITVMHKQRLRFIDYLLKKLPEVEVFGEGIKPIGDKSKTLIPFTHHIAFENHTNPFFWTEKLSDPLLCGCQVFYAGHRSVFRDFSREIVHGIDLNNFDAAYGQICENLSQNLGVAERLKQAQDFILKKANVHSRVIELLDQNKEYQVLRKPRRLKKHYVPLSHRLRFHFSRR
jgi:hypothetical protein